MYVILLTSPPAHDTRQFWYIFFSLCLLSNQEGSMIGVVCGRTFNHAVRWSLLWCCSGDPACITATQCILLVPARHWHCPEGGKMPIKVIQYQLRIDFMRSNGSVIYYSVDSFLFCFRLLKQSFELVVLAIKAFAHQKTWHICLNQQRQTIKFEFNSEIKFNFLILFAAHSNQILISNVNTIFFLCVWCNKNIGSRLNKNIQPFPLFYIGECCELFHPSKYAGNRSHTLSLTLTHTHTQYKYIQYTHNT